MDRINTIATLNNSLFTQKESKVVITTHHKPDGDAIGSSLGLYHFLTQRGVDAMVITPTDYAHFLHDLPGNDQVLIYEGNEKIAAEKVAEADFIFCLDFNQLERINELGEEVAMSKAHIVLIDHHRDPAEFFNTALWTYNASSTCELIYEAIVAWGGSEEVNADMANCIYTGIMTDTGSFRYPSTTAKTHETVAHLIKAGAEPSKVHQMIFDNFTLRRSRFTGFVLYEKLQVFEEYNTALVVLNREELQRFNVQTGDTEGFVNFGLGIKGVKFSVLIIDRTVKVKMSFRSKGEFGCNTFAAKHFSGGGHFNAAGGASDESLEATVEKFKALLPKYKDQLC